jgi:surface antigen
MKGKLLHCIGAVVIAAALMLPAIALAVPPPWAPAHGYRAKQHHHHHYFGVLDGRCNREEILGVLGGAAGAVIGGEVAENRTLGAVAGAIIGVVVGSVIGRSMDEADRYCTGHALEYVSDHQSVVWFNPDTRLKYIVMPVRTRSEGNRYCRDYVVKTEYPNGRVKEEYGRACRNDQGAWRILN